MITPSATSPPTSVISSPTAARNTFGAPYGIRAGAEERRHQRVRVEVAAEVELGAVVPRRPDRAHREDVLAHACRRVRPRHREPPLDVRLDLRPEAEEEPALRVPLQVVGGVRREHRRARERDRDAGAELDALGVLGRDHERQERVARRLGRDQPVVAELLELARPDRDVVERARHDPGVDLHGPTLLCSNSRHPTFRLAQSRLWRRIRPSTCRRPAAVDASRVHLGVSGQLYRRHMTDALPMPRSLSPSSMSTFTSCPLAFRFSYIERLPEPPSAPASKGTLVHLALQHLMWRPPAERTIDAALARPRRGRPRSSPPTPSSPSSSSPTSEWASFHADAEVLLRRYFEIEDPRDDHGARASSCASPPRRPTAWSSAASSTGSSSMPTASS